MLSYTAKRLAQTIFVLLGISLITFILLQVVPGDPVAMMLEKRADPETIAKVRHELGLDLPYHVQYLNFLKGASALISELPILQKKSFQTLYFAALK